MTDLTRRGLLGWLGSMLAVTPLAAKLQVDGLSTQEVVPQPKGCSNCDGRKWNVVRKKIAEDKFVIMAVRCIHCGS